MLTKTEIMQQLAAGRNCAMVTFGEFAESLGYDKEETDAIAAVFGGGMEHGSVCGAVTGAYMTLGAFAQNKEKPLRWLQNLIKDLKSVSARSTAGNSWDTILKIRSRNSRPDRAAKWTKTALPALVQRSRSLKI